MALPEQIRKQAEAVQELYKQLNPEKEEAGKPADEPSATVENAEAPTADENTVAEMLLLHRQLSRKPVMIRCRKKPSCRNTRHFKECITPKFRDCTSRTEN